MIEYSEKKGLNMSVAVVDATDTLVSFARMDNAVPLTTRVCLYKAHTVLEMRRDTAEIVEMLKTNQKDPFHFLRWGDSKFSPILGGVLLKSNDDAIVGAIGCSGSVATVDEEVARVGGRAYSGS